MAIAKIPENEAERLEALRRYSILDTLADQAYDDLTTLAACITDSPIALISLVDDARLWFKSRVGLKATEMPREHTFCSHAIVAPEVVVDEDLFVVSDATRDNRFSDFFAVLNDPNIRFYAAAPLITPDKFPLGTLCVIDRRPRELTDMQRKALAALGRQVISQLELRLSADQLKSALNSVEERTAQLVKAQADLLIAANAAGKAEVATNVLHNVGNVLNSVNTSANLVAEKLRSSKIQGFLKAVDLLNEHQTDLADFLTNDDKGKVLPSYLSKVSVAIEEEHKGIAQEMTELTKNINHISEIVDAQQSYASAEKFVLPSDIQVLVDDALRISEGILLSTDVQVRKECDSIPLCMIDKAKVVHILVNLISNAVHAMNQVSEGQRILTLRTQLVEQQSTHTLRISISDTGNGIAKENITRIFAHGYTTRSGANGFGLHSSATSALEMDGTLTAHSEGLGKGARFVLEFPVQFAEETQEYQGALL